MAVAGDAAEAEIEPLDRRGLEALGIRGREHRRHPAGEPPAAHHRRLRAAGDLDLVQPRPAHAALPSDPPRPEREIDSTKVAGNRPDLAIVAAVAVR